MNIFFASVYIEKRVEIDDFEKGCDPNTTRIIIAEPCHVTAKTLPELIEKLGKAWGLEMDDIFVSDDDGEVNSIVFSRLEDGDSNPPTKRQEAAWKEGKVTLFLADYTFAIEKRTVESIKLADFVSAGITTHG